MAVTVAYIEIIKRITTYDQQPPETCFLYTCAVLLISTDSRSEKSATFYPNVDRVSRLLYSNLLPTSNFIETPECGILFSQHQIFTQTAAM